MRTEEEWTEQRRSGTTAASPLYHSLNSVGPPAGSTHTGLEHLHADLCQPLGWIPPRPSALSDRLLSSSGVHDVGVWASGHDGVERIALAPRWSGPASRVDALSIRPVLALRAG